MDRTRERITRAAIELHGTIGPAATTMSAVAEKAGVTRATLYRHFANEEALFSACSADWLAANPRPDLARWAAIDDPTERLRTALDELYAYNRSTEAMRANLLRDIDALPARIADWDHCVSDTRCAMSSRSAGHPTVWKSAAPHWATRSRSRRGAR